MNNNKQDKELSIQINLNGFSFSVNTPTTKIQQKVKGYNFDEKLQPFQHLNTVAEWSMPNVLIVPFDLFDHSAIDAYLTAAQMIDKQTQRAMFAVSGEIVALWAVDHKLYEKLNAKIINLQHTHSLLKLINSNPTQTPNSAAVYIDPAQLMHIAMWSEYGLETAQSIQIKTQEDILYYIKLLSAKNDALTSNITIYGNLPIDTITLLKAYFPTLIHK